MPAALYPSRVEIIEQKLFVCREELAERRVQRLLFQPCQ